jgi:hypothetical protein
MLLAKLHIAQPGAHIDGTYRTMLQASDGYRLSIRSDISGVIASREKPDGTTEKQWIPFAACRNGVLLPADQQDEKGKR